MTAQSMAMRAYAQFGAPTKTERQAEYDTIARVTHELKSAAKDAGANFPRLAAAVHKNNQLWTILATDVSDTENGLPRDLRARILYLAEFTKRHSAQVLGKTADAAPLIEINTAILRGLNNRKGQP